MTTETTVIDQAGDETLHRYADRIKARAINRCGQLAKLIPARNGARTDRKPGTGAPTRLQAATAAGMSKHQLVQAIRVANVPAAEFERQVESERP